MLTTSRSSAVAPSCKPWLNRQAAGAQRMIGPLVHGLPRSLQSSRMAACRIAARRPRAWVRSRHAPSRTSLQEPSGALRASPAWQSPCLRCCSSGGTHAVLRERSCCSHALAGLAPRDVSLFAPRPPGLSSQRATIAPRDGAVLVRTEVAQAIIRADAAFLFPNRRACYTMHLVP